MEGQCSVCREKATSKCSNCHNVFYCSKEHQKKDWKTHKTSCKPVIIKEDKKLGRHLVASKDIKDGHIVFKEKPLIIGPAQMTPPVCLGCMKTLSEKDSCPCTKCGWPVCNEVCQNSPNHKPECDLTVARGSKIHITTFGLPHPNYQCLTALRCLYQKKHHPEIWERLIALESHCDLRKGTVKWQNDKLQVLEFIKRFFKLDTEFTDEEIMKVCGIIQVNGHEVPLTDSPFVAIYDTTSMVEHSCRANCNKSFTSHGEILIVAATNIKAGDNISICYTDPLWGTINRRHHLEETKFFNCTCVRCSDVTDLGTMFSAIRCQKEHCNGALLPKSFLSREELNKKTDDKIESSIKPDINGQSQNNCSTLNGNQDNRKNGGDPLQNAPVNEINEKTKNLTFEDNKTPNGNNNTLNKSNGSADKNLNAADDEWTTNWSCDKCDFQMSERSVLKLMEHVGKDLEAMQKGSCESCLRFLQHYGKFLHHNNFHMVDVSMAMAHLIGQEEEGSLPNITDERLHLKIDTCRSLINILEKIAPAEVRARGSLLFELHAGIAELGRRRTARTGEGPAIMIQHLTESLQILKQSMHLLQHEPEELPEGMIAKQAKKNFAEMESYLINLHALEIPMM